MRSNLAKAALAAVAISSSFMALEGDAKACGGCFIPTENPTVVTDHRMILSVSKDQSTLYDQIKYSGSPSSFAWVLPISGTVEVGLSADIVFQALDGMTQTRDLAAAAELPAASRLRRPEELLALRLRRRRSRGHGVTVTKREVVGPYETVQLKATDPGALAAWLATNGFNVPADVQPVVDQYVNEKFDFLALKLVPGKTVQDMRPVRVTTKGASSVLPLRMVAAGTGSTVGIGLWVVGEGRYETQNFPSFVIPTSDIAWDWSQNKSNYTELRAQKTTAGGGKAWEIRELDPPQPLERRERRQQRLLLQPERRRRRPDLLRPRDAGAAGLPARARPADERGGEDGAAGPGRGPRDALPRRPQRDRARHPHARRPRARRAQRRSRHDGVGRPDRALEHPPAHQGAQRAALPRLQRL